MDRIRSIVIALIVISCSADNKEVTKELKDGSFVKYSIKNGQKNGTYKTYYSNGELRNEMTFDMGEIVGKASYYDVKGKIEATEEYEDGVLLRIIQYHPNGRISVDAERHNEYLNGKYFQMNESGDTLVIGYYKADTTYYLKAYDHKGPILDHYVDPSYTFKEVNDEKFSVTIDYYSPDPNLKWGVIFGRLSDSKLKSLKYGVGLEDGRYEKPNRAVFDLCRSILKDGYLEGYHLEHDQSKNITFRTPFKKKLNF